MTESLSSVLQQVVFAREDLVAAGMSSRSISRRVTEKLFVRVGPGLLCLAGRQHEPLTVDTALAPRTHAGRVQLRSIPAGRSRRFQIGSGRG